MCYLRTPRPVTREVVQVVATFGTVVIVVILPVQSTAAATVKCLLTTVDPSLHLMFARMVGVNYPRSKQSRGEVSSDESDTDDELPYHIKQKSFDFYQPHQQVSVDVRTHGEEQGKMPLYSVHAK